nr:unnamed protein product [Spirometra erinaceieuropaei]
MLCQFHDVMMARVTDNGDTSEAFAVTKGVKRGRILAPANFSLMCSVMLTDACRYERPGAQNEPFPSQQPTMGIVAEVAGPDLGHGCTGVDGNLQHLCHAETSATALERPPYADGQ